MLSDSSNLTWLLVGFGRLAYNTCLVYFWCMLEGSVEVWTKNIEGQTYVGMPRGAKLGLALHEPG